MPDSVDVSKLTPEQKAAYIDLMRERGLKVSVPLNDPATPASPAPEPSHAAPLAGMGPMWQAADYMDKNGGQIPDWLRKITSGALMGLGGMATGGGLPMALMGMVGGYSAPPRTLGEGLSAGASIPIGGALGAADAAAMRAGVPPLMRQGLRAAGGYGAVKLDQGIRQAAGDNAPSNLPDTAIGMAMPTIMGGLADTIQNRTGKRASITAATAQREQGIRQAKGVVQNFVDSQLPNSPVAPSLQDVNANVTMQDPFNRMKQLAQETQQARAQQQQQAMELTVAQAQVGQGKVAQKQALDKIVTQRAASGDTATKQAQAKLEKYNSMIAIHRQGYDVYEDPRTGEIRPGPMLGSIPDGHGSLMVDPSIAAEQKKSKIAAIEAQKYNIRKPLYDSQLQQIADAAGADPAQRAVQGNLSTIDKRIAELKTQSTQNKAQDVLSRLADETSRDPMPDHVVAEAVSGDINKFKAQLLDPVNGTDLTRRLMQHFANSDHPEDGDTLRRAMLQELFSRAYDPQTKTISNLPKLINGDPTGKPGMFNRDKITALYGDGPEAQAQAQRYTQAIGDLQNLADIQATPDPSQQQPTPPPSWGDRLLHGRGIAFLPSGLLAFNHNWKAAAGTAAIGLGVTSADKLIDAAVNNPALGAELHKWANGGGGSRSLMLYPEVRKWIDDDGNTVKK